MLNEVDSPKRKIVVLEATAPPKPTTEYVDQVVTYANPQFEFRYLSPRTAFRHADVFHVHWPELIVRGRNVGETLVRCFGFRLLLGMMRMRGTAIVRTLHNLKPHEPAHAVERWVTRRLDQQTHLFVSINPITEAPSRQPMHIPHGHYRDSYSSCPKSEPISGRVTFVGMIRPYKGVDRLIDVFRKVDTPGVTLRIAGKPTAELKSLIQREMDNDPRITGNFGYLSDREFVTEVTAAELICLPYVEVHNSGTMLAALSLDRPVLVKRTPTTSALADEVGPGWVFFFEHDLGSADIDQALTSLRTGEDRHAPKLEGRDWRCVARRYGEAFLEAMRRAGKR